MTEEKIKNPEEKKESPKAIAPALQQMIFTDLGNYGGIHTGIDKLYYLMSAITQITTHLEVNYGSEWFYKNMEEELKNSPLRLKKWDEVRKAFEKLKPLLSKVKAYYDDIRGRKEIPKEKQIKVNSLVSQITPYHFGIYYVFNIMMKISGIQRYSIPRQYFRTSETSKYVKTPLDKPSHPAPSQDLLKEGE